MSGRRPRGELQFGSDSFLDVVANIVGILIILIVIAGLRVSKMPVVLTPVEKPVSTDTSSPPVASSLPEIVNLPESKEEPTKPQVVVLDRVKDGEPEPVPPPLPA